MRRNNVREIMRPFTLTAMLVVIMLTMSGCYYVQAARGQLEINRKREPIKDVIAAADATPDLVAQLQLINEARQFSIDELQLPDNDSYRSYADLERDYVVWSIVAVPEFSTVPKSWCYPIAGCVSYRGYFSQETARKKASRLREDGYDVAFGGVAAYSTLGKFDDPVLNTMMHWGDEDLVAVMFHELAHQVLYIKDETEFNESFATAVEEIGMERWLAQRGETELLVGWRSRRTLRAEFSELVELALADLKTLYASGGPNTELRAMKQALLEDFAASATQLYADAGQSAPGWLQSELNNARLASTALYQGRVQEFRELLAQCNGNLPCFYKEATRLAEST